MRCDIPSYLHTFQMESKIKIIFNSFNIVFKNTKLGLHFGKKKSFIKDVYLLEISDYNLFVFLF